MSHPLTCPESRKWSASLLLGYVWSWLLPTDGAVSKHPRRYTFVFFSAFFPVRCPGQLTLKTTRNQVPHSLSWTGPQSLSLYFQLCLQSSPQPDSVSGPTPTPPQLVAKCQSKLSLPAQHLLTLQPPASLCLQQNPRALPLPPQPALGGPTLSHSFLISVCVRRKGISFAIYPRSSLQKELKDTLRSVKKTRPELAKRAQVVILIMWNSPLFMENFLL